MTKIESPGSLAEFELFVMLAALRLGPEEAYTVSIVEDIERHTGRHVRRANVYTTLDRLEAKGYVRTQLGDPRPERGGKRRRLVSVEPPGVAAVRATAGAIHRMMGDLDRVDRGESMTVPRWTAAILKRVVPPDRIEDVLGDLGRRTVSAQRNAARC